MGAHPQLPHGRRKQTAFSRIERLMVLARPGLQASLWLPALDRAGVLVLARAVPSPVRRLGAGQDVREPERLTTIPGVGSGGEPPQSPAGKPPWPGGIPANALCRGRAQENGRPWCWALLGAVLLLAMVSPVLAGETEAVAGSGSDAPAVELGPFQRFLANPPWIKYVRFRRSGNQEPTKGVVDGEQYALPITWAVYDGALQPNGFFLRHLAHTSLYYNVTRSGEITYEPPKPGEEWMVGASTRFWWQLDDMSGIAAIAPREPEIGHSEKHGPERIAKRQKQRLEPLRYLGMTELVNAEVKWLDATHFQATTGQYGKIEGRVTRLHGDLVEELEYRVERPVEQRIHMRYRYSPQQQMPPVEMVRTILRGNTPLSFTNLVDVWEEGLDPLRPEGFTLSELRRKTEPLQFFLVWSNGVSYSLSPDGTLVKADISPPDYSILQDPSSRWLPRVYFWTALAAVLLLSAFGYGRLAGHRKPNKTR